MLALSRKLERLIKPFHPERLALVSWKEYEKLTDFGTSSFDPRTARGLGAVEWWAHWTREVLHYQWAGHRSHLDELRAFARKHGVKVDGKDKVEVLRAIREAGLEPPSKP